MAAVFLINGVNLFSEAWFNLATKNHGFSGKLANCFLALLHGACPIGSFVGGAAAGSVHYGANLNFAHQILGSFFL